MALPTVAFTLVFVALTTLARAEPGDPPAYLVEVARGVEEYDAGRWPEARSHFQRAHALSPNARTLRALGSVEFALRNYADSVRLLEAAKRSTVRALTPEMRAEVDQVLQSAYGYVDRLRLELDPPSLTILVNGVRVALDSTRLLVLEAGDHLLEFRAQHRATDKRRYKSVGGREVELRIELRASQRASTIFESPWFWSACALVAGGVIAGTMFALDSGRTEVLPLDRGSADRVLMVPP